MRPPTRTDYLQTIQRAAGRPQNKQLRAEAKAAKIALKAMDTTQPSPDAVASPAAPEGVEYSSEVEMTTTTQQLDDRLTFQWNGPAIPNGVTPLCANCGLGRLEHINSVYCPEWRLRQLDGDR